MKSPAFLAVLKPSPRNTKIGTIAVAEPIPPKENIKLRTRTMGIIRGKFTGWVSKRN